MEQAARGQDLIDVVIRLPRKAIEETLLSMPSVGTDPAGQRLIVAKSMVAARRRRTECFTGVYFSDPSWDIILELYVALCEDRAVGVSSLCRLSRGSATTALRSLDSLDALGYTARRPDTADRRRVIVAMLPKLANRLETWLDLHIAASPIGV